MITRRTMLGAAAMLLGGRALAQSERQVGGAHLMIRDNRLWMPVGFGERGPYSFIIDTGTFVSLIRMEAAEELALRRDGVFGVRGVGGRELMPRYEARDVTLGSVNVGTAHFGGYLQQRLPIHPEAVGAVSAALLTIEDSDLDFEAGQWRMYLGGRGERTGYELLPSRISGRVTNGAPPLYVEALIGGARYRLQVDTGAPGQVVLFPAASRRSGLWRDDVPFAPSRRAGIGGDGGRARIVRGPELSIGGIRFERPLLSLTDPAARAVTWADGLLGLELIQQINFSTDVRASRLWGRRNGLAPPPERYGMSGLWVEQRGERLEVTVIGPASPAAEAGLQRGDEIIADSLPTLIRSLAGRPGDVVDISYRRNGEARQTRLTLREYL